MEQSHPTREQTGSLAAFISSNTERILAEWESFARKISPDPEMDRLALRDHAGDILRAIVSDMRTAQSGKQQFAKSRGGEDESGSQLIRSAAEVHAGTRMDSGYDILQVVAEYRAMRASVLRLWKQAEPSVGTAEFEELSRFNEAIDQSLAMALDRFTALVDRSRDLFLAILGHDLRNPVAAISMNAQILSMSDSLDAKSAHLVGNIRSSADAMGRIIADLLVFAGSQLGVAMPITTMPTELCGLCREVVDEARAAQPERGFDLRFSESEINGQWDSARIRQMLSNLLCNACQHGEGLIEVHVSAEGEDVELVVRSGGEAIAEELLPMIFDPLVHNSYETSGQDWDGSLGLGLFIVQEVVHGHNGTIGVESSEEKGTVFTVHLPRHAKA